MNTTNATATPSSSNIIPVSFRDSQLILIEHNGEPYVAMRSVVEGMGLNWASQSVKLRYSKYLCCDITTQMPGDDQTRNVTFMPLRRLNGWLFSINPLRVSADKRELVERYQEECFFVLYDYWTKGQATNPRTAKQPASSTPPAPLAEATKQAITTPVASLPPAKKSPPTDDINPHLRTLFALMESIQPKTIQPTIQINVITVLDKLASAIELLAKMNVDGTLKAGS